MSRQVTKYEVDGVETRIEGMELSIGPQIGLELVLDHTLKSQNIGWQAGWGGLRGGHLGLDATITEILQAAKPEECGRGPCQAEIEFCSAEQGVPGESAITISCPAKSFPNSKAAKAFERKERVACIACQSGMRDKIEEWLAEISDAKTRAEQQVDEANQAVLSAEAALEKVFELE